MNQFIKKYLIYLFQILKLYNINAITRDSDAQGEVAVKLEHFNIRLLTAMLGLPGEAAYSAQ